MPHLRGCLLDNRKRALRRHKWVRMTRPGWTSGSARRDDCPWIGVVLPYEPDRVAPKPDWLMAAVDRVKDPAVPIV